MVIMGDFNTKVGSITVHINRNITPNGENILQKEWEEINKTFLHII